MNHKRSSTSVLLGVRTPVLLVASLLCLVIAPVVRASTSTQLFFDDFTGTALDTSRWSVFVDKNGDYHWPYVADGLLHSQGYHTRIDSIPAFAPMGQSVMARARIRLAGEYHQFGFAVNPNERAGPINGYYFDTLSPAEGGGGGREHHVRALAWSNPGDGSLISLLDVEIPVPWYEFHEFAIERTPSEVIYSIDGQEVARVADAFAGALPVCVWNARWDLMQTDWVEVSQIIRVIVVPIDIKPDTLNLNSKGKWVTCYVELPQGYDVSDIDVDSALLEGLLEVQQSDIQDGVLMVKFDREDLAAYLDVVLGVVPPAEVELVVMGNLTDGTPFEGKDTIRVIDEGGKK